MFRVLIFSLIFLGGCATTSKIDEKICAGPKAVGWNHPGEMSEIDKTSYESAKLRCQVHYPNSPCLKEFKRVEFQKYYATCGKTK